MDEFKSPVRESTRGSLFRISFPVVYVPVRCYISRNFVASSHNNATFYADLL